MLLLFVNLVLAEDELLNRTEILMGTFITISTQKEHEQQLQNAFTIISDVETSLSSYSTSALVYRLNHEKKVHLDANLYEALQLSKKYYQKTSGYFDITIGSITKQLYKFGEEEQLPNKQDLQNANVNFKGLSFDTQEAYLDENITLDLGGMGKGFGVDKVADYFRNNLIQKAIISISGDIRCIGRCQMNIQNPYSDTYLASFETLKDDTAISTSGNYRRYVQSKKNNHLINPKLKRPAQNFISVTLISSMKSSDIDAYATAVSVMPKNRAYAFLDSMPIAYIILQSDQKLVVSKNINSFITNLFFYDTNHQEQENAKQ